MIESKFVIPLALPASPLLPRGAILHGHDGKRPYRDFQKVRPETQRKYIRQMLAHRGRLFQAYALREAFYDFMPEPNRKIPADGRLSQGFLRSFQNEAMASMSTKMPRSLISISTSSIVITMFSQLLLSCLLWSASILSRRASIFFAHRAEVSYMPFSLATTFTKSTIAGT